MPISCSMKGCKSRYKKGSVIHFFSFPFKDSHQLECWTKAVGRENWKATPTSKICSLHFLNTDFLTNWNFCNTWLRSNAVPTLLLNNNDKKKPLNIISTKDRTEENKSGDIQLLGSSTKQAVAEESRNTSVIKTEKPENDIIMNTSLDSNSTKSIELKKQHEIPQINERTSTKRVHDEERADASAVRKERKVMFPDDTCIMMQLQSSSSETSDEENTATQTKIKQLTDRNELQTKIKQLMERNKKLTRRIKTLKQIVRKRDLKIKEIIELLKLLNY